MQSPEEVVAEIDQKATEIDENSPAIAEADVAENLAKATAKSADDPVVVPEREAIDIFLWANNLDQVKNDLDAEFYFVNRRYTPYLATISGELQQQVAPVFVYEILNDVAKGAGLGLAVRDFEMSEEEEGVLLRTTRGKVANAETVLNLIEHSRGEIEHFNEYDHEFKNIKMIVARFTHKDLETPFYVVKQIMGSGSLNQRTSWEIEDGKIKPFEPEVGFKIPVDNQVLIVGADIFAFKPGKFEKIFDYDYKKQALADEKVEQILEHFKLSFPEGMDLQSLVRERKSAISKLQKIDPRATTQAELLKHSEEMDLDLMVDDDGAIIIMDGRDLDVFVGLLNDDFVTSDMTGKRYEIKGKKPLDDAAE